MQAARCLLFLLSGALTAWAPGEEPVAIIAGTDTDHWNLVSRAWFLDEEGAEWGLADVLERADDFRPVASSSVNFGLRRSASWFRVAIQSGRSERANFYVEISNARLKRVDFYVPGMGGADAHQQAGTSLPVRDRTQPYRKGVFRLTLEPGETQTVYLRVYHRGSYRFLLTLWEHHAFLIQHTLRSGFFGMFYGSLAIMMVFNMVLFGLFRDRSFLWLSIFILCVALYMVAYQRIDAQYLWPDRTNISGSRVNVLFGIGMFAAFYFSRSFLDLAKHAPRWDLMYRVFALVSLAQCIDLVVEGIWMDWLLQISGATAPILFFGAAITRIRQGYRLAWGYLIAWSATFTSMTFFALLGVGVLPQHALIEHGPKFGFSIALALNSIGLWQRFKAMQDAHAANLDQQVAERTHELQEALDSVKTLKGLIPICSSCKSIRDDEGFWTRVETYIIERSDADFTHGICPDCVTKLYGKKLKGAASSSDS